MDADKLLLKYIDVIEDAFELGMTPETLSKMVWSNKTKPNIKIKVFAALALFLTGKNFKSPRAATREFIKSDEFKNAIPADFAKKKKGLIELRTKKGVAPEARIIVPALH